MRICTEDSPFCLTCKDMAENAEHVIFSCPRYINEIEELERVLDEGINLDNITDVVAKSERNWSEGNYVGRRQ